LLLERTAMNLKPSNLQTIVMVRWRISWSFVDTRTDRFHRANANDRQKWSCRCGLRTLATWHSVRGTVAHHIHIVSQSASGNTVAFLAKLNLVGLGEWAEIRGRQSWCCCDSPQEKSQKLSYVMCFWNSRWLQCCRPSEDPENLFYFFFSCVFDLQSNLFLWISCRIVARTNKILKANLNFGKIHISRLISISRSALWQVKMCRSERKLLWKQKQKSFHITFSKK